MRNFLKLLKVDLHRAFFSGAFLSSVLATLAVFLFGMSGMMTDSAVKTFNDSYGNNIIKLLFLPSTFVYSASFCIDWQSRFNYFLIIRSERKAYALSKCLAAAIAGGLAVVLGAVLFIGVVCIATPAMLPPERWRSELEWQAFGDLIMKEQVGRYFLAHLFCLFLQAAFSASLGLTASAYLPNKYVAYMMPFILGFVIAELAMIFQFPFWLNPVYFIVRAWDTSTPVILLRALALYVPLILLCILLFMHRVKRRLENG